MTNYKKRISEGIVSSFKKQKILSDFFPTKDIPLNGLQPESGFSSINKKSVLVESSGIVEDSTLKKRRSLCSLPREQMPSCAKFDKKKWISGLTDEERQLLDTEITTMDDSWLAVLHEELQKPYFLDLKRFLATEECRGVVVFPPRDSWYSWTRLSPLPQIKVLILGQDPYHNYNQAHGLAFSVKDPKTRIPPSLKNMYKLLKTDYPSFKIPDTADLTQWAQRGVLLLNTCLTVRAHNANSHSNKGWETFTKAAIQKLIDYNTSKNQGIVVMAWGGPAQRTIDSCRLNGNHLVLKTVHPSPLSASRGFFDSHHYRKCNEWLVKRYGEDAFIDWSLVKGNVLMNR
ncbi:Uracil-DNA glycosylase [Komagataella phaffii GS115]|uniref:Uracil-DNA glycosylase n=1 Tax=Komagataella phaffii (strain GS115 / ATCC 20864) TaxID=644223 RepID=C4R6I5_KOMPG|nr:Uracil-DNA glycosylase [Komagataella phaffii GS115]CAY71171.1 Uracil-DNA glycosylase [Komagataella phaffii GS115]